MKTFWDVQPTWQNSVNVLEEIKEHCKILGAFIGGQLVGYLVFNPEAKKIYQLAVSSERRRKGIGTQLLVSLKEIVGASISVINVDEDSVAANKFLQKSGLKSLH